MHGGAIGVAVYNNFVHDFGFAGIRCGDRISEVFGCAMTDVSQNLVVAKRFNATGDADAAGLYWNTHWYAPGEIFLGALKYPLGEKLEISIQLSPSPSPLSLSPSLSLSSTSTHSLFHTHTCTRPLLHADIYRHCLCDVGTHAYTPLHTRVHWSRPCILLCGKSGLGWIIQPGCHFIRVGAALNKALVNATRAEADLVFTSHEPSRKLNQTCCIAIRWRRSPLFAQARASCLRLSSLDCPNGRSRQAE